MSEFASQIVLITGAKGGLGTHVTQAFLNAGATVVGVSKSIQPSAFSHPAFVAMPADLLSGEAALALVEAVITRFQRVDILAHVAGGFAGGRPVSETDDSTWDQMMNLNLQAAFNAFRAVLPPMRQAGRGRIIAIASRAAVEPQPMIGAYSASKAALVSLVRTVALENKDRGITANAILPGTIDTAANRAADPNADRSRWIDPAHLASLVLFLASGAAAQLTGAAIPVYGAEA
jgi:NAD(P)-dependent dehydrogenase (short-subunit alcohol dehydrogenase family)